MPACEILRLSKLSSAQIDECVALLLNAFADLERYSEARIRRELAGEDAPFYRHFFAALAEGRIQGIAGVKAADWASDTHLLYLSAVLPEKRGQGIGRQLVKARLEWIETHFKHGRILLSTGKPRRFRSFGFSEVPHSVQQGRRLMMRRF